MTWKHEEYLKKFTTGKTVYISGYCLCQEIGRAAMETGIPVGIPTGIAMVTDIEIQSTWLHRSPGNRRPRIKNNDLTHPLSQIPGYSHEGATSPSHPSESATEEDIPFQSALRRSSSLMSGFWSASMVQQRRRRM